MRELCFSDVTELPRTAPQAYADGASRLVGGGLDEYALA
jgi:hypothetical protein